MITLEGADGSHLGAGQIMDMAMDVAELNKNPTNSENHIGVVPKFMDFGFRP